MPEAVRRFDFPVLLLTGDRSPARYEFYYNVLRACHAFPPTIVIPDAGHAMHRDNRERFLAVAQDFLASTDKVRV